MLPPLEHSPSAQGLFAVDAESAHPVWMVLTFAALVSGLVLMGETLPEDPGFPGPVEAHEEPAAAERYPG